MDGLNGTVFVFGPFRLDVGDRVLRRDGQPIPLSRKEFDTLLVLLENNGRLVEKDRLIARVWPDAFVGDGSLARNISVLRKTLGDELIQTVPRVGYRLAATISSGTAALPSVPNELLSPRVAPIEPSPNGERQASPAGLTGEEVKRAAKPRMSAWLVGGVALAAVLGVMIGSRLSKRGGNQKAAFQIIPVTSSPGEKGQPAFSPDGKELAYRWRGEKNGTAGIYVQLIGAGAPLRLASDACSPAWSPDGRYIAFARGTGYYSVPALGGPERKLADTYGEACAEMPYGRLLDWSPDGKSLAVGDFINPSDTRPSVLLISVDNGQRTAVVPEPAGFVDCPAFSPDGSKIAYAAGASYQGQEIYVVPTAGGKPRQLTSDGVEIWGISWTADGSHIVFSSVRGGVPGLWTITPSGGTLEPASAPGLDTYEPAVARNGNRLAYLHHKINLNIWRMPGPYPATPKAAPAPFIVTSGYNSDINFSADGKRIAYQSDRNGECQIWTANSDGTDPLPLNTAGVGRGGTPRWSPDGRSIAFDGEFQVENHSDIFVVSAQGGSPRRLTREPFENVVPSWSRDGQWVYFSSDRTGTFQVWKVPAPGGLAVQVTKNGGLYPSESPDGKDLYYSKPTAKSQYDSSSQALWKMPVEGGPETRVLDIGGGKVIRGGVCFVDFRESSYEVKFLDFATNRVSVVSKLDVGILNPPLPAFSAFDVSPEGKWILYGYRQLAESDIMLVEGFH